MCGFSTWFPTSSSGRRQRLGSKDNEVGMTRSEEAPVLVTGATGQVGSGVVDQLLQAGVPVRRTDGTYR